MKNVTVNFDKVVGVIKDMNAVNNAPLKKNYTQTRSNFDSYKSLNIPYARTHDSIIGYGSYHKVDITQIFPNFDADVNDPASYDFVLTDEFLERIMDANSKVFFRLGETIEHDIKKYQVNPPKDFKKWAQICEHIIMHLNYGWADGHEYGIEYFEIWNEPNLIDKACWTGSMEEFYDLYKITATHLKKCFPDLKIGGPAFAGVWEDDPNVLNFLKMIKEENVPMDFFSWHRYDKSPEGIYAAVIRSDNVLKMFGLDDRESILDEYNYINDWGAGFVQSVKDIIGVKGAAFTAGSFLLCQNSPVHMLMYYDARFCAFNGIWDYYTTEPLPTFYSFKYFDLLKQLGNQVEASVDGEKVYAVGASDGKTKRLMFASFDNDFMADQGQIEVQFNLPAKKVKLNLTTYKGTDIETEELLENGVLKLTLPAQSVGLIEIIE